jgi:hypothetical protein
VASYQAIAATGQAILGLLADSSPKPEFAGANFELYQAINFHDPMEEGISLYLYRIAVNGSRRNLPPSVGPDGIRYRPPIPLDLYYMLTAWAKTAARQQRLLGWALRVLEDVPVLPSGLLNHYGPEPEIFTPHETVELIFEPLALQDMSNMWHATKVNPQLSVTYVARMIRIDSTLKLTEGAHVQTRALDFGKVPAS